MCFYCKKQIVGKPANQNSLICQYCNEFFCPKCVNQAKCMVCGQAICDSHAAKCNACEKRTCPLDICLSDITFCAICQGQHCAFHFEDHKKFDQAEPFKLNCKIERCKITQGIGYLGIENLSKCFAHMQFLKELRLRTYVTRKQ